MSRYRRLLQVWNARKVMHTENRYFKSTRAALGWGFEILDVMGNVPL